MMTKGKGSGSVWNWRQSSCPFWCLVSFSPFLPLQKAALSVFGSPKVSNKGKRLFKTNPVSCHFRALGWIFRRGGRGKAPWVFFEVLKNNNDLTFFCLSRLCSFPKVFGNDVVAVYLYSTLVLLYLYVEKTTTQSLCQKGLPSFALLSNYGLSPLKLRAFIFSIPKQS